jgi:hypothetical protein
MMAYSGALMPAPPGTPPWPNIMPQRTTAYSKEGQSKSQIMVVDFDWPSDFSTWITCLGTQLEGDNWKQR